MYNIVQVQFLTIQKPYNGFCVMLLTVISYKSQHYNLTSFNIFNYHSLYPVIFNMKYKQAISHNNITYTRIKCT